MVTCNTFVPPPPVITSTGVMQCMSCGELVTRHYGMIIEPMSKEDIKIAVTGGWKDLKPYHYSGRKYLPTLSELIDRLSIVQLKEVFIPEHKAEYAQEIKDICHDIDIILKNTCTTGEYPIDGLTARDIRAIIVLAQMNLHIWHRESNARKGLANGNDLMLTHGLNGIRNTAKNVIQESVGGRKDYKIDCLASEFKDWEISWF